MQNITMYYAISHFLVQILACSEMQADAVSEFISSNIFLVGGRQTSLQNNLLQCIIFRLAKGKVPPNTAAL